MSSQLALTTSHPAYSQFNSHLTRVNNMREEVSGLLEFAEDFHSPVANELETLYKEIQTLEKRMAMRTKCLEQPGVGVLVEDESNTKKSFKFHVSVPEGAKEGFVLFVKTPNGVKSSVRVPKGAKPGSILICTVNVKETDLDELD